MRASTSRSAFPRHAPPARAGGIRPGTAIGLAVAGVALLSLALCSTSDSLSPEGGPWYTGDAGSTHTGLGRVDLFHVDDRGRRERVDHDVFVIGFVPPDCILYEPGEESGTIHAACGRHAPVPVAFYAPWHLSGNFELTADGLRRTTNMRVQAGRAITTMVHVPIDSIRRAARSAPLRGLAERPRGEGEGLVVAAIESDIDVDPAARDRNGWTPLHEAVRDSQPDVVRALLAAGADVNARIDYGSTALLLAVEATWLDTVVIRTLLDARADTELANRSGLTPLLSAALRKRSEAFTMLLAAGADPCARDAQGRTIVDLADDHARLRPLATDAWRRCTR